MISKQKLRHWLLDILWELCDDIEHSTYYLYELYDNVPERLQNVSVGVTKIYDYDEDDELYPEIIEWLEQYGE